MPTSLAISNEFVSMFGKEDGIAHMKLQKLVYCTYGWWLAARGPDAERLTSDRPEIWKHGPVFGNLYRVLQEFGRKPIKSPQSVGPFSKPDALDEGDGRDIVNWIWNRYGHLSGVALSEMAHEPGSPWHRLAVESEFMVAYNTPIPDQYIYEEFRGRMPVPHGAGTEGNRHGR